MGIESQQFDQNNKPEGTDRDEQISMAPKSPFWKRMGVAGSLIFSTLGVPSNANENDKNIDTDSSVPIAEQILDSKDDDYKPYDYENATNPYDLYLTFPTKEELIEEIIKDEVAKNNASVYEEVWDEQRALFEKEPAHQKDYFIETWKERTRPSNKGIGTKYQVDDVG